MRAYLARVLPRPSIRLRLTLVYAVVVVATCTALLALNYGLLYQSLYPEVGGQDTVAVGDATRVDEGFTNQEDNRRANEIKQAALAQLRTETLLKTAGTSALALAVTAVLGLGLSWILAGRMLRPLRTLTSAAQRISQDRLHERIALTGPRDELKELADTFDQMVARLEASFASQRRFVADASHELRTPLAIVRTGAEVLLTKRHSTIAQWQAMGHRVLTATGRAERLLNGLLALARSDSGVLDREPHDLAVAAADAVSETDDEAARAGLTITTDLRPAPVNGDPVLLDRLVQNLVDNATRHNHRDGWIEVTTSGDDIQTVVQVRNSGPVIQAADVDRLFEPFQRLESARTTAAGPSGLGLPIVRSIVRAHRGTVAATPIPGGGLAVTVTLPATPPRLTARPGTKGQR